MMGILHFLCIPYILTLKFADPLVRLYRSEESFIVSIAISSAAIPVNLRNVSHDFPLRKSLRLPLSYL
jgi:hypothetical protein